MNKDLRKIHHKKLFLGVFCFFVLFLLLLKAFTLILYTKNDITRNWQTFYSLDKNKVDILIVGSSHAYASFDPERIREMTGKETFLLACPSQYLVQTYYNVKEALRYQHPDTIILEAFSFDNNNNFRGGATPDRDWRKEANIDGMRMGKVKFEAINAQYEPQNRLYAWMPIVRIHENWKFPLTIGSNLTFLTKKIHTFSVFHPSESSMTEETAQMYADAAYDPAEFHIADCNIAHFRMLAELCREENITLYVVMAPMYDKYISSVNYDSWTDQIAALAESEGVYYLDCNRFYDQIGLNAQDFEDLYISYVHLNYSGAEKVTDFVTNYILEPEKN